MNRMLLVLAALAAALLLPAAAVAKGPSEASISGPGLSQPLEISGDGETAGTVLGVFTERAGFFPAVFRQEPDPMLRSRPKGKLGPRYTIRYLVPGPYGEKFHITQDLYPYAAGGAVTYTKPGQPVFGSTTHGGWFAAGAALKQTLVAAGLAPRAPKTGSSSFFSSTSGVLALVASAASLLLLGWLAPRLLRRRPPSAPAG
jgi:hypothetical protein